MQPLPRPSPITAPHVLCLGDMGADILASPLTSPPAPGKVSLVERIAFHPGGNALNTAVALQRLGEQVAFVGTLGDDPFGDLLLAQLERLGLDLRGVRREPGAATPTTLIYRAQGEDRRFIHARGAGDRFTGDNVPEDLIPTNGVLLAAGYLKLRFWNDAALLDLFEQAHHRHSTVVLNVCIPSEARVDLNRCLRLLPHVDTFVLNEDEAQALTGTEDTAAQARVLRQAGAPTAIITRGARGSYAADGNQVIEMGVFSVPLVDPSGCGDCFTAGLIAALLRRWDLTRTLELASAIGALGATALGCTTGVPPWTEAERFLRENQVERTITPALC